MYCKHCGEPIDDNSQFCKFCGKKLVDTKKVTIEITAPNWEKHKGYLEKQKDHLQKKKEKLVDDVHFLHKKFKDKEIYDFIISVLFIIGWIALFLWGIS